MPSRSFACMETIFAARLYRADILIASATGVLIGRRGRRRRTARGSLRDSRRTITYRQDRKIHRSNRRRSIGRFPRSFVVTSGA